MRVVTLLADDELRALSASIGDSCALHVTASVTDLTKIIRRGEADLVVADVRDHLGHSLTTALSLLGGSAVVPRLILRMTLRPADVGLMLETLRVTSDLEIALVGFDDLGQAVRRAIKGPNILGS